MSMYNKTIYLKACLQKIACSKNRLFCIYTNMYLYIFSYLHVLLSHRLCKDNFSFPLIQPPLGRKPDSLGPYQLREGKTKEFSETHTRASLKRKQSRTSTRRSPTRQHKRHLLLSTSVRTAFCQKSSNT